MKKDLLIVALGAIIISGSVSLLYYLNHNEKTQSGIESDIIIKDSESETDNSSYQSQNSYNLTNFKNDVKKIVPNSETIEMAASLVGAKSGIKIKSGNSQLEIYEFDENSNEYKTAEEDQQLMLEGFGSFSAIVKNGYALTIDDNFPEKEEIEKLFNDLK